MQLESLSFGGFFKATGVAMVALLLSGLWGSFGPQLLMNANRMEKKKVAAGSLVDSATAQKEEEVAKLQEVVDASGMTQSPSESSDFAPNGEPINTPGTSGMTQVGSELRVTAMSATGGAHTFGAQGSLLHTNSSGMLKDAALADTSKDQKQTPGLLKDAALADTSKDQKQTPGLLKDAALADISKDQKQTPGLLKDAALADTSKDQKQTPGLLKDAALADTSKEAEPGGDGADDLSDEEFFEKVADKVFEHVEFFITKKYCLSRDMYGKCLEYDKGKLEEKLKKVKESRIRLGKVESGLDRRNALNLVCTNILRKAGGPPLDTIIAEVKEEDEKDKAAVKARWPADLGKATQELRQKIIQSCPEIKMEFDKIVKSSSNGNDKIELSDVRELISALVGDQVRQGVDTESKGKHSKKTMDDWFEELPSEDTFQAIALDYDDNDEYLPGARTPAYEIDEFDYDPQYRKYGEGPFDYYTKYAEKYALFLEIFTYFLWDFQEALKDGEAGEPYASYLLPFKDGVTKFPEGEPSASGWEYLQNCHQYTGLFG